MRRRAFLASLAIPFLPAPPMWNGTITLVRDVKFIGTTSGRLSCSQPNYANIPRTEEVAIGFVNLEGVKKLELYSA